MAADAVVIDLCRSSFAQITKWARPASRLTDSAPGLMQAKRKKAWPLRH